MEWFTTFKKKCMSLENALDLATLVTFFEDHLIIIVQNGFAQQHPKDGNTMFEVFQGFG